MKEKTILVIGSIDISLLLFRKELMIDLQRNGFKVITACPDFNEEVIEKLKNINIEYHQYYLQRTGQNPFLDLKSLLSLKKLIKKINPSHVLTYTIKPNVYTSLALFLFGMKKNVKQVSLVEGLGFFGMREKTSLKQKVVQNFLNVMYRWHSNITNHLIFLNPDDLDFFKQNRICTNENKMHLLNGIGVDLEKFYYSEPPKQPVNFLLISRMIYAKGVKIYLEAAKTLKKQFGNKVHFYLVGPTYKNPDSIPEELILEYVSEGIIDYTRFTEDVLSFYKKSSVFVLPSYYREGLPRTIMEAMSVGRPIITTDNPGCRETVEDTVNGFLIPVKDVSTLIDKMNFFVKNPEEVYQMGIKSREIAEVKFDINVINSEMIKIII